MKYRSKAASKVGQLAIPFILQDEKGRDVRLEDFLGSWLLIIFHRHLA